MKFFAGLFLACAMLLTGPAPAKASQVLIVIEAVKAGEDLKAGTQIKADTAIKLGEGARLSLLSESGRIVVLNGPYEGIADSRGLAAGKPDGSSVMTKLSKLIEGHEPVIGTGASRDIDAVIEAQGLPHPSYFSVMKSGNRCAVSRRPELWRDSAGRNAVLVIQDEDGEKVSLIWPAGQDRIDLPEQFLIDGATIAVSVDGILSDLRLYIRPPHVRSVPDTMAWMAENECNDQAKALLNAVLSKSSRIH